MKLSLKFLLIVFACPYAASNVAITTAGVPNGTKGTAYSAVITASGGCTPYKWAIVSGNLPAGVVGKPSTSTKALNLRGSQPTRPPIPSPSLSPGAVGSSRGHPTQ